MSFDKCKTELRKAFPDLIGKTLTEEDFEAFLSESIAAVQRKIPEKDLRNMIKRQKQNVAARKAREIRNNFKMEKHREELKTFLEKGEAHRFFENLLVGSTRAGERKNSLAIAQNAVSNRNRYLFNQRITKDGLELNKAFEIMESKEGSEAVLDALYKFNAGDDLSGIPSPIKTIARSIRETHAQLVSDLRELGADVNTREDFLVRQTHDPAKLAMGESPRQALNTWVEYILPKLDQDKTFSGVTDPELQRNILASMYDDILNNQNESIIGRTRALHFKDGKALSDYHSKYGRGSLLELMNGTIRSFSKREAMASVLGPEGFKNIENLREEARKFLRKEKGLDAQNEFDRKMKLVDNLEKEVRGYGQREADTLTGKLLDGLKNVQLTTKLGSAIFATFTDLPMGSAKVAAMFGKGLNESMVKLSTQWTKNLSDTVVGTGDTRKQIAALLNYMTETELNRVTGEVNKGNGIGGRFQNFMMKMTGLEAQTSLSRESMAAVVSSSLAEEASKGFNDLHPNLKAELGSFGIGVKDWDKIRQAVDNTIEYLPLISMQKLRELNLGKEIETKYGSFLEHAASFGAISPDAKTRGIMRLGKSPNSVAGKAISNLTLFKTFGMQAWRSMDEIARANPGADNSTFVRAMGNRGNLLLMSGMMGYSFAMAYFGLTMKDIFHNRTPRDPTEPKVWKEVLSRSIIPLGFDYTIDALAGDYDNFGRSFLKDLAGPSFGQLDSAFSLTSAASKDLLTFAFDRDPGRDHLFRDSTANKLLSLLKQNTPGIHMPLVRPVLDWAALDGISSLVNPNYMRNKNKRLLESGQQSLTGWVESQL